MITSFKVKLYNIYNINEIGFQMGSLTHSYIIIDK